MPIIAKPNKNSVVLYSMILVKSLNILHLPLLFIQQEPTGSAPGVLIFYASGFFLSTLVGKELASHCGCQLVL